MLLLILGMANYGKVLVGDEAFEYYNDKNVNDYIQIPWSEVTEIMASVMFKGKWIPRFAVVTKNNGNFIFSTRDNKKTLRAVRIMLIQIIWFVLLVSFK